MPSISKASVGSPAPPFVCKAVIDGTIREVSLSDYTSSNHWLLLIFIPLAWSFVCPTELLAFSARHSEFLYHSACAVVFISTDSEFTLRAWNATSQEDGGLGGVHLPLLSDRNHLVSLSYGVLDEEEGTSRRALFIIDPTGTIRYTAVNDANIGRSVDEAKRMLQALQFSDEYGEGCPSDWRKGQDGVKMNRWDYVPQSPIETNDSAATTSNQVVSPEISTAPGTPTATTITAYPTGKPPQTAKPLRPQTLRRISTNQVPIHQIRSLNIQAVHENTSEDLTPPPATNSSRMQMDRRQSQESHSSKGSSWASTGWTTMAAAATRKMSTMSQGSVNGPGGRGSIAL